MKSMGTVKGANMAAVREVRNMVAESDVGNTAAAKEAVNIIEDIKPTVMSATVLFRWRSIGAFLCMVARLAHV